MLKLIIGNKAYSSWSMRGWLAVKQSALPFEEVVLPLYEESWETRKLADDLAPSSGKVPLLWDGDIAVWESLAIIDYLADKVDGDRFWPADPAARGFARSISAEMHAGYQALRSQHPTNMRRRYPAGEVSAEVKADLARITGLWAEAKTRFGAGGDFLFGAFSAADIMFAPVVTRIATYDLPVPEAAQAYCGAVLAQPFVAEWLADGAREPWVIDKFERA
ncbi:glutathione S-transferase [Sphingomonas vulcanisoli]|uniref:Glutathione S-transferase n=1 Tax=Sphingomonas vulcanisoli TaxID=1658060 RepID=A0ABX0TX37_9SPHN|nr:glutathione S-transferase family protein [Sphingomonas vulcanisoli]NIJ08201.1 glutathione S-transferase [Sphingomonas vulcanisoli]